MKILPKKRFRKVIPQNNYSKASKQSLILQNSYLKNDSIVAIILTSIESSQDITI